MKSSTGENDYFERFTAIHVRGFPSVESKVLKHGPLAVVGPTERGELRKMSNGIKAATRLGTAPDRIRLSSYTRVSCSLHHHNRREDVRCLSMPPEESGFSQPPDARIWMPAATPPASTRQARFPEFAETACTHPKAAWIEGAAPSKLIPRLEGAPYAPCYSETLPPTLSAQTPTIVAHFTIARARIPPVYPSEQSTYRSSGQRLAPLEPSDANPYPLFYRGGGCRGGGVSNATGSRSSWSTGTRVSSCQPKPIAQEAAGLRPFRLHPWQPSAARAVDQGWYPSPWEVYGDQLRSGFLEDYTSRTGGVGSGSLRESTSRPSAVT